MVERRVGSQTDNLTLDHKKSGINPIPVRAEGVRHTVGELQVRFRPCPNRRSEREVMNAQSPGSPNRDSFGTPLWESRDKEPFGRGHGGATQRILYGGKVMASPKPRPW
jgi:hypothetical protein